MYTAYRVTATLSRAATFPSAVSPRRRRRSLAYVQETGRRDRRRGPSRPGLSEAIAAAEPCRKDRRSPLGRAGSRAGASNARRSCGARALLPRMGMGKSFSGTRFKRPAADRGPAPSSLERHGSSTSPTVAEDLQRRNRLPRSLDRMCTNGPILINIKHITQATIDDTTETTGPSWPCEMRIPYPGMSFAKPLTRIFIQLNPISSKYTLSSVSSTSHHCH